MIVINLLLKKNGKKLPNKIMHINPMNIHVILFFSFCVRKGIYLKELSVVCKLYLCICTRTNYIHLPTQSM